MKQTILYLKAAAISVAASLIVLIVLVYHQAELLDALFYAVLTHLGIYFGMLAAIEGKTRRNGNG